MTAFEFSGDIVIIIYVRSSSSIIYIILLIPTISAVRTSFTTKAILDKKKKTIHRDYLYLVFFEPTDRRKASKILHKKHAIAYASPNLSELREMATFLDPLQSTNKSDCCEVTDIVQLSPVISRYIKFLIITIGSKGVVTIKNLDNAVTNGDVKDRINVKLYPTEPIYNIENVSGAGDSFASGLIHGLLSGLKESQCIAMGFKAAKMTLSSKNTVSSKLNSLDVSPIEEITYKYLK